MRSLLWSEHETVFMDFIADEGRSISSETDAVIASQQASTFSTQSAPISRPLTWLKASHIALVILGILAALGIAYFARPVVLPILAAAVISMALKPPVRWLRKCHMPTPLAAAVVLLVFVSITGYAAWHLGRPAVVWVDSAPESLTRLKEKFQHLLRPAARLSAAASTVGKLGTTEEPHKAPQKVEVADNQMATTVITWTGDVMAGIGKMIVLVFLLLAAGDFFMQKLVRMMPTLHDKKQAVEISRDVQQNISTYLFSVGLINVTAGILIGLVLFVLGLPNAMMWGGVAALANFIPYFGPLLTIIAVALAGLVAFDSITLGLLPALAYFAIHLIESNLITPYVLGRRFLLNPVVIFIALIFFAWLWGVAGALLAVPILTTFKALCVRVPALSSVDEFLSK
jgi:predicted PurR-regulated permease PerM